MKNLRNIFLLVVFICFTPVQSQGDATFAYRQEFKAFETNPHYRAIFDEDAHVGLKDIQADVENYKQLSFLQRCVRFAFLGLEVVVVTPETMPMLYGFIDTICKEQRIKTPTVFIAKDRGFFNAGAQKLLVSSGAIVIGKKLLEETSDKELQGVVAHELGHIVHNHVNKSILINYLSFFITNSALQYIFNRSNLQIGLHLNLQYKMSIYKISIDVLPLITFYITSKIAPCIVSCIINKRFEKQADEFAYRVTDNGEGVIEFFEHLKKKEQSLENDFDGTYFTIKDNKAKIGYLDYYYLMARYGFAKAWHMIDKGYRWIYHNTRLGAHPSHENRIKAAKEYLAQQS